MQINNVLLLFFLPIKLFLLYISDNYTGSQKKYTINRNLCQCIRIISCTTTLKHLTADNKEALSR